jgi:hypothetical protein
VTLHPQTRKHLGSVVLLLVDRILAGLGQNHCEFIMSLTSLAASSVAGLKTQASEFSLDLPVFLCLLSAALELPIAQDTLATGHIASLEGDLCPVEGMVAKLQVASEYPAIRRFIYPALDIDGSLRTLSPAAQAQIHEASIQAKSRLMLCEVRGVHEVIELMCAAGAVAVCSLSRGFHDSLVADDGGGAGCPAGRAVRWLRSDNTQRFWNSLQQSVLDGNDGQARQLLTAKLEYHRRIRTYPKGFGAQFLNLVRCTPTAIRTLRLRWPLADTQLCIDLLQSADRSDHADCHQLVDAVCGEPLQPAAPAPEPKPATIKRQSLDRAVEALLSEIGTDRLTEVIYRPVDRARASFPLGDVIVQSPEAFYEATRRFYAHLLGYVDAGPSAPDTKAAEEGALDLVRRAFARLGNDGEPVRAAIDEAHRGTRGGMQFILNAMADQYKAQRRELHVARVLAQAVNPMDWKECVALTAALLRRWAPSLPEALRSLPARRCAGRLNELALAYVASVDGLCGVLRTL